MRRYEVESICAKDNIENDDFPNELFEIEHVVEH